MPNFDEPCGERTHTARKVRPGFEPRSEESESSVITNYTNRPCKKEKIWRWRIGASIPLPGECESPALPFELIPPKGSTPRVELGTGPDYPVLRESCVEKKGIDPFTSRMLSARSTI